MTNNQTLIRYWNAVDAALEKHFETDTYQAGCRLDLRRPRSRLESRGVRLLVRYNKGLTMREGA
jgi:hypothetical protein